MTIYIAGKFSARYRLRPYKTVLEGFGHTVSSSWLDQPEDVGPASMPDDHTLAKSEAARDLYEVADCDIFLLDTIDESNTGGRDVELGYALHAKKDIGIIGPLRNVFHTICYHWATWEDMFNAIYQAGGQTETGPLPTVSPSSN